LPNVELIIILLLSNIFFTSSNSPSLPMNLLEGIAKLVYGFLVKNINYSSKIM